MIHILVCLYHIFQIEHSVTDRRYRITRFRLDRHRDDTFIDRRHQLQVQSGRHEDGQDNQHCSRSEYKRIALDDMRHMLAIPALDAFDYTSCRRMILLNRMPEHIAERHDDDC